MTESQLAAEATTTVIEGESRPDEPEAVTSYDVKFRVVAMSDPLSIYGVYVDQELFDTYEQAGERGLDILKFYPAFVIDKVFIR